MRPVMSCVVGLSFATAAGISMAADHPSVYVNDSEREYLLRHIEDTPWMAGAYAALRRRVEPYVTRHADDPEWITSRMLMNWDTHYVTPIVEKDRWVRGEGRAPVPTPRYAGARDWASEYGLPGIDELRPYNDRNGLIWARKRDGTYEWVHPSKTGHSIEKRNLNIIDLARDASFIYWLTQDRAYASFAGDIFWQYMYGFSHKSLPHNADGIAVGEPGGPKQFYGTHTFEVIHDNIVDSLAVTYDFLYDYLVAIDRDVVLCQAQFRRMAERIIAGGNRTGNWNLHQAESIAYAGLVLEEDAAYADQKGRQHYINIVLHADLPRQQGLYGIMRTGYEQDSGIWPEAFGYGTGVTVSITKIASLIARQQEGPSVLDDPVLTKAALVQFQWLYPNGRSIGLGDTTHARARTMPLELLATHARRREDPVTEGRMIAALRHEMAAGRYKRTDHAGLFALCSFLPDLDTASAEGGIHFQRTFYGKPLNAFIQRNLGSEASTSFMAALYGTEGGHTHENGLALEFFGGGEIIAPDPGPGSSYWRPDHGHYYRQRPAHNTVVVDGKAVGRYPMDLVAAEPFPGQDGVSSRFSFTEASFREQRPAADQRRVVVLVRTSAETGFYLDVFRSRADAKEHQSHDYIYHNLGQTLEIFDAAETPVALASSDLLGSDRGDQAGYDYFEDERSILWDKGFQARFSAQFPEKTITTSMWMCGGANRRLFTLTAPRIVRGKRAGLPGSIADQRLPTVLIRQGGEAWNTPFAVLYEPGLATGPGPLVTGFRQLGNGPFPALGVQATGRLPAADRPLPFAVTVLSDPTSDESARFGDISFRGRIAGVFVTDEQLTELYLGEGQLLATPHGSIEALGGSSLSASLRRLPDGWAYSTTAAMRIRISEADGVEGKPFIEHTVEAGEGHLP